jgi:hypothetical protein
LVFNETGVDNTAIGFESLYSNNGSRNTATGYQALHNNKVSFNTADGYQALYSNTSGGGNTATGAGALYTNSIGGGNTANGQGALYSNASGGFNTAVGASALYHNTVNNNTATGDGALYTNVTGSDNTALGHRALYSSTGTNNIAIGSGAGSNLTTGDNNIDIGAPGAAVDSARIRIGVQGTQTVTLIAGIYNSAITGTAVVVNGNGRLGVASSSQRFKDQIKSMDNASEAILALRPVTFRYKPEIDPERIPQFGLVAEEVEKINPALVTRDAEGKVFTVRYEAVNAMLLNEFLKEHRKNEEQEATIARQQKQIEALTAGLQKVSAQVEMSRPAPQMAENNQ